MQPIMIYYVLTCSANDSTKEYKANDSTKEYKANDSTKEYQVCKKTVSHLCLHT